MRNMLGIPTAVAVLTSGAAAAAGMTKEEYRAGKARVLAEYQADRQKCGPGLGNPADVCIARARGAQQVARAELEAAYKPSPKSNYEAAIARAQAAYSIAKQECDFKVGEERKGCVKQARTARERAQAEAMAARKTSISEQAAAKAAGAAR